MTPAIYMTCRDCQRQNIRSVGRGLCGGCYDRHWHAGTLDKFPKFSREPGPMRTEKPCAICKVTLPLESFAKNNRRPDGRGSYCKACAKAKYHAPARERKRQVPRPADVALLHCLACDVDQPSDQFYWQADKGRFANICKSCRRVRDKAYRDADPQAYRDKVLRRKYGIGLAEFAEIMARQGGGCGICGASVNPDSASLAVDHCHASGRVRGILCGPCNKAIGLFHDDVRLLREAVRYLKAR